VRAAHPQPRADHELHATIQVSFHSVAFAVAGSFCQDTKRLCPRLGVRAAVCTAGEQALDPTRLDRLCCAAVEWSVTSERCVLGVSCKSSIASHPCAHIGTSAPPLDLVVGVFGVRISPLCSTPHRVSCGNVALKAGCSHSQQSVGCHARCALFDQASRKTMIIHLDAWCP
jgi:hypothetical protein